MSDTLEKRAEEFWNKCHYDAVLTSTEFARAELLKAAETADEALIVTLPNCNCGLCRKFREVAIAIREQAQ